MKVSVCLASRGRPEKLEKTIAALSETMELEDTVIAVALDRDDAENHKPSGNPRVRWTIEEREDCLGEKYNRAYALKRADVYLLWADDMVIVTPGWDRKLADAAATFGGDAGVLYFGAVEGVFLPGVAVTQKFVDAMGFFHNPYFSFWWGETWIDEIARMADRILHVNISVQLLEGTKGKSRGVREIPFWAELFDLTRPKRRAVAEKIIDESTEPLWRKVQLRQRLAGLEQWCLQRNSKLRDPEQAKMLEKFYSSGDQPDERYSRMKAKASDMKRGMSNG